MRIAILISGRGSNMAAIIDAVQGGRIPNTEVVIVVSDKSDAAGLAKAAERNVETLVIERRGRTREEHDAETVKALKDRNVDLVCLAGYMRLLSPLFVKAFADKIINIHPSLLPDFPGLDAQRQAIEAGATVSGCSVHFVDDGLDSGPVILQRKVDVLPDDTAETLSARILAEEHDAYIEAINLVV